MLHLADQLSAFAIFATIAAFTPGPNNIMLAASGANFGLSRSMPHIFGITAGFMSVVIAGGLGLGSLFTVAPLSYDILRVFALGFLIYLGYKLALTKPSDDKELAHQIEGISTTEHAKPLTFWAAFAFQWMNPKALIVVFSAITAYMSNGPAFLFSLTSIIIIFLIVTILSTVLWCWLGTMIAYFLSTPRAYRIFNISMAILLVASLLPALTKGL